MNHLEEDRLDTEMMVAIHNRVAKTKPTYVIEKLHTTYIVMACYGGYRRSVEDLFDTKLEAMEYILELESKQ